MENVGLLEVRPATERLRCAADVDGDTAQVLQTAIQTRVLAGHVEVRRGAVRVRVVDSDPLRHAVCIQRQRQLSSSHCYQKLTALTRGRADYFSNILADREFATGSYLQFPIQVRSSATLQ